MTADDKQLFEVAGVEGVTKIALGHLLGCASVRDRVICWGKEDFHAFNGIAP